MAIAIVFSGAAKSDRAPEPPATAFIVSTAFIE
jgi:hypothetical protein